MKIGKDSKQIIINYHYVEDPKVDSIASHPCSNGEFDKQISHLKNNYEIVDIPTLYKRAQNGHQVASCALTFDDGLKCQYKNALPILNKHEVPATFFIITGTLEGFLPSTHKIHALLSKLDGEKLVEMTNEFLTSKHPELVKTYLIPLNRRVTDKRKLRDSIPIANFKETLNILPPEVGDELLDWLLKKAGIDTKVLSESLFMNEDQIRELDSGVHTVGCHGHYHYALDSVEDSAVRSEIENSLKKLSKIIKEAPKVFSYPHGGSNELVAKIANDLGILYSVTIKQEGLSEDSSAHSIPRFDVVDLRDSI